MMIKKFLASSVGSTAMVVGITFPILLMFVGFSTDIGRVYAAQSKAQNALDAAILGGVATLCTNAANACENSSTSNADTLAALQHETTRLFNANFPQQYMGTQQIGDVTVTESDPTSSSTGTYTANVTLSVPMTIMNVFNHPDTQLNITSQATKDLAASLELSLVLDNSGSMNCLVTDPNPTSCPPSANSKLAALQGAATNLTNILFGSASSLNNLHISVVPFINHVNLGSGPNVVNWIQSAFQPSPYDAQYSTIPLSKGDHYLANRNADVQSDTAHNDFTDAAPGTEATNFRTPYAYGISGDCGYGTDANPLDDPYNEYNEFASSPFEYDGYVYDIVCPSLTPISFALDNANDVTTALNSMNADGATRINVGLMWGWNTLSPNWQGAWGNATLPAAYTTSGLTKTIVLMTDGQNELYVPTGDTPSSFVNDDDSTNKLCTYIKAQGIIIYTIGFGVATQGQQNSVNAPLLQACATDANHYYLAPTNEQLQAAFKQIADDILDNTLRLSK